MAYKLILTTRDTGFKTEIVFDKFELLQDYLYRMNKLEDRYIIKIEFDTPIHLDFD